MPDLKLGPADIARDRWGRPLISPVGGGNRTAYQRCTTFVGPLEDTYNLTQWKMRTVVAGIADPRGSHLLLAAAAHKDDKKKLGNIADEAFELGGGSTAATTGTALHALTERLDKGEEIVGIPEAYAKDLEAYREVTADLEPLRIEQFVVVDSLKVAGTADRIYRYTGPTRDGLEHDGLYIGDVKTGKTMDFGFSKIEMQLAVYAHGTPYDIDKQERDGELGVSTDIGLVIHLPAGTGSATLYAIPLKEAWDEAVKLAQRVHAWRKRKRGWLPLAEVVNEAETPEAPTVEKHDTADAKLADAIARLDSPAAIKQLWADNATVWNDGLTELAKKRIAAIAAGK